MVSSGGGAKGAPATAASPPHLALPAAPAHLHPVSLETPFSISICADFFVYSQLDATLKAAFFHSDTVCEADFRVKYVLWASLPSVPGPATLSHPDCLFVALITLAAFTPCRLDRVWAGNGSAARRRDSVWVSGWAGCCANAAPSMPKSRSAARLDNFLVLLLSWRPTSACCCLNPPRLLMFPGNCPAALCSHIGDTYGRSRSLLFSIILMAFATCAVR